MKNRAIHDAKNKRGCIKFIFCYNRVSNHAEESIQQNFIHNLLHSSIYSTLNILTAMFSISSNVYLFTLQNKYHFTG